MDVIVVYQNKIELFSDVTKVEQPEPGSVSIDNEDGIKADQILILPD